MSDFIEKIFPGQSSVIEKAGQFATVEAADTAALCLPEISVESNYTKTGVLKDSNGKYYKMTVKASVIIEPFED